MRAAQLLAWCVVGTLSVGACGGKTEGGGSGGSGAQAGSGGGAGTAGSGAVAGSGAFGGAGGAMGGMGGMAAMGGTGAMGGMGAVGGGGGGSLEAKAEKVCAVINQLPCALPNCKKELGDAIGYAQSMGCTNELGMILDCALSYPLGCAGGEPSLAPPCQKYSQAFQDCIGVSPGCDGWGSSDGSCGMSCGYFDVTCKPFPGGGLQCSCDSGPNAGKVFNLPGTCNSPGFEDAINNVCG